MDDRDALSVMAQSVGLGSDYRLFDLVCRLDRHLRDDKTGISYDEVLREVVENNYDIGRCDTVLVDEAQDSNRIQLELIAHLRPTNVIAVGDPRQAIYAFRGADATAIETLSQRFGITQRLPLSVTYRCSREIVRLAQQFVPSIEARPGAPDGVVDRMPASRLMESLGRLSPGDIALCRTNRPLIGALLHRRRLADVPVRMIGEDLGRGLIATIERAAKAERTNESARVAAIILGDITMRTQQLRERNQPAAAEALEDEGMMAVRLLQETTTVGEAVALARTIFAGSYAPDAVNFATIHRSKGLEADRVIFLGANLVPNRRVVASKSPALLQQEYNLLYVAYTRAQNHLILQDMRDEGDLS